MPSGSQGSGPLDCQSLHDGYYSWDIQPQNKIQRRPWHIRTASGETICHKSLHPELIARARSKIFAKWFNYLKNNGRASAEGMGSEKHLMIVTVVTNSVTSRADVGTDENEKVVTTDGKQQPI